MELIGKIGRRKIYYVQIRNNSEWKSSLPKKDWIAFTISNNEDKELIYSAVNVILNKNVLYACNAGEFGSQTEDYFLEEIGWRGVQFKEKTGEEYDYDTSPMTSTHRNFGEGFWFASVLATDGDKLMDKVVCIDFTKRKVRNNLIKLVEKINNDWLPNNKDIELAKFDV
ncbi:hypothetical protein [Psychroserpens mesophilus]|uniref:hypothetical protein n=1 Tax=Psychroserpens mesophilus TaxID=325473 RepID=UPI003D661AF8